MSPEYGMLVTVAAVFIPAGIAFLWAVKRSERRKNHEAGCCHITPANADRMLEEKRYKSRFKNPGATYERS